MVRYPLLNVMSIVLLPTMYMLQFVATNIPHSSPPPFHSFPPVSSILSPPPPPMDLELPTSTYMPTSPCLATSSLTS